MAKQTWAVNQHNAVQPNGSMSTKNTKEIGAL